MAYLDRKNNRLIYIFEKADSNYWDKKWIKDLKTKKNDLSSKIDLLVVPTTKKYLRRGSEILEGGCGHGTNVLRLQNEGYRCTGIDFAKKTIKALKKVYPKSDFRSGDVRKLPFPREAFDGYWSLGVIEHFYSGYENILTEMHRVLKRGGYVFATFPYMSPLRRIKAKMKMYSKKKFRGIPKNFYQFALDEDKVIMAFRRKGFTLVMKKPYDGVSGLRKELSFLRFVLNPLSKYSKKYLFVAGIRFILSKITEKFASHSILLVFKKKSLLNVKS